VSDTGLEKVIKELKTRGLRAGEEEGQQRTAQAEEQAQQILDEARAEAERIKAEAEKEAEATRRQMEAELRQMAAVGLQSFRKAVESSCLVPTVEEALVKVLGNPAEVAKLLSETIRGFVAADGKADLDVILPEAQRDKLERAVKAKLVGRLGAGIKVRYDDGFTFGFKLSPKKMGFLYDFTDEGFKEVYLRFLAPRFREYFFST